MSYEFEFDITQLVRELLSNGRQEPNEWRQESNERPDIPTTTANASTTNATTANAAAANASTANATLDENVFIPMMQRNQNTIDELIYTYNLQMDRYNQNMDRYNQNMDRLIQILQSSQTRLHQYMISANSGSTVASSAAAGSAPSATSSASSATSYASLRRNAAREDANLVRAMLSNPLYRISPTTTTSWIYSYLYPNGTSAGASASASGASTSYARSHTNEQQRQNAVETIVYDGNTMRENVCPISLLPFTQGETVSQIKHCRHIFKRDSLTHWLTNYSCCCPVCRYDIRNYVSPSATDVRPRPSTERPSTTSASERESVATATSAAAARPTARIINRDESENTYEDETTGESESDNDTTDDE